MQSPRGTFFRLEMPITETMASAGDDAVVEIHEGENLVKLKFTVTESSAGGWNETREIVRSLRLPQHLEFVELHCSRAYIDRQQSTVKILIPTSGQSLVEDNRWKEIRTKVVPP